MKKKVIAAGFAVAAAFVILVSSCSPNHPADCGNMSVVFFDVGQGDSALLITPNKKTILIDCGKDSSAAEYLNLMNITRIDVMIITHPDIDHSGGCSYVLSSVNVSEILTNKNVKKDFTLDKACSAVLEVIVAYDTKRFSSSNDNSVLLKASYKDTSFLFTGDCGWKCENELVKTERITERIDIDILKVGHHGSRHSSTDSFLKKTSPSAAVISVGKNNYGHPHNKTLERLNKMNLSVHRTDIDGIITITTDGRSYEII